MIESLPEQGKPRARSRTALVTGGTRGIGLAIVERLRADGLRVIAWGREDGNLCNFSDTTKLCNRAESLNIDVLVNCAGVSSGLDVYSTDLRQLDEMLYLNVRAPFALCRSVLGGMLTTGWGRIVNIASIYSLIGRTQRAAYIVSKHALDGLTKSLSADYAGLGVLANTVSPGVVDTDMTRSRLGKAGMEMFAQQVPIGRIGQASEVAALVSWLVSEQNTYVTGQNIAVDGGFVGV